MMHGHEKSDCDLLRSWWSQGRRHKEKCGLANHATDSEPRKRVTGAGPHTANQCR
jgi:hypothetical protein